MDPWRFEGYWQPQPVGKARLVPEKTGNFKPPLSHRRFRTAAEMEQHPQLREATLRNLAWIYDQAGRHDQAIVRLRELFALVNRGASRKQIPISP